MSDISTSTAIRRPALKTGRRPVHRSGGRVQFGPSARDVVLSGFDAPARAVLDQLDGRHDRDALRQHAHRLGLPGHRFEVLMDTLANAGVLEDAAVTPPGWHALSAQRRRNLTPALDALTLAHRAPDLGKARMGRRLAARVLIRGSGGVSAMAGHLLAASGVGTVSTEQQAGETAPDLALLVDGAWTAEAAALMRTGTVHLLARSRALDSVIGPLVVPGHTSCLRCHDLHRADADPDWPRVAAQLAAAPPAWGAVHEAVADTLMAAHAAHAALTYLDTGDCALADTTATLVEAGLTWHRQRWTRHPECGCTAGEVQAPAAGRPGSAATGTMGR
ncbi:MAG: hypothetical protein ACT4P1_13915 [Sporichthyaceae bacterium]